MTEPNVLDESNPDAVFEATQGGEGTEDTTTKPDTGTTPEKIKIGEEELTHAEIQEALQTARQAKELEKGARQKFDEASAMRKLVDENVAAIQDKLTVVDAWFNGTPEQKRLLISELAESQGLTIAEAKQQLNETLDETKLTDEEAAIYRNLQSEKARNDRLEARLKQLEGKVDKAIPSLEEIGKWASTKREAEQIQDDIISIKTELGVDASPEKVKAWRDHGIKDIVKFAKEVMLPELKAVRENAPAKKPDEVPADTQIASLNEDDPDVTPDQIMAFRARHNVP